MAEAVADYAKILWIDPPRSPLTRNRKEKGFIPVLDEVTKRITRLTPVVLPGHTRVGPRAVTPALMRLQARRAMRRLDFRPDVVVMLYLGGLLGGWGDEVTNVLYGTDDYVAGAELMRASHRHLERREQEALARADKVVAVSSRLTQRWSAAGVQAAVIPNGCWPLAAASERPDPVETGLPRPVVGLIGRLSDRIDLKILEKIAEAGQSLLIMGPRDPRWGGQRFDELVASPSVHYAGPVSSARLPGYLAAVDVGIVPYKINDFNEASFPLKTLEYLGMGLPVITTGLQTMRWLHSDLMTSSSAGRADQILRIANDGEAYVQAIDDIVGYGSAAMEERLVFAHRHSWRERAQAFAREIGITVGGENVGTRVSAHPCS